jgi:hypothetical protein
MNPPRRPCEKGRTPDEKHSSVWQDPDLARLFSMQQNFYRHE